MDIIQDDKELQHAVKTRHGLKDELYHTELKIISYMIENGMVEFFTLSWRKVNQAFGIKR